jgi:hypothetical protein
MAWSTAGGAYNPWGGDPADPVTNTNYIPVPQQFGAIGDGVTDDSAAINTWAAYLRTNNLEGYIPGGKYFCGTSTLYLGGITFRGAGSGLNNRWPTVQTNFVSNANPIIMMAVNATTAIIYQGQDWSGFTVSAAGGAVAPVPTWFNPNYTGQIGIALGRSLRFVQATTDPSPEVATSGGVGSIRLRDFTVQDVGGIGVYIYKLWGDSLVSDGLLRCCGGVAAKAAADNTMGGGMFVDSLTVDTVIERIHAFATGNARGVHADETLDHWGTAFQVGRDKITTDALNRIYDSSNNLHFNHCHSEGYYRGFKAFNSKWATLKDFNSNGSGGLYGRVTIGHASNPAQDCRWQVVRLRVASAEYVEHCQDTRTSFTEMTNATPGVLTGFRYWRGITFDFLGCGHGQNTPAEAGWTVLPQSDPTTQPGGAAITDFAPYLPFAVSAALPTDPFDNLLPTYNNGAGGTALVGWTAAGTGTATVSASGTFVSLVGGRVATSATIAATAGEIMTARVYCRVAGGFGGSNVIVSVIDNAAATVISRRLADGLLTAGLYMVEVNFTAPSGGTVRLRVSNADVQSVDFVAPRIVRGLAPASSATIPNLWAASNGIYATA